MRLVGPYSIIIGHGDEITTFSTQVGTACGDQSCPWRTPWRPCGLEQHLFIFIYKLRTQCHTITAETVQNSNRHWHRPTKVLKHSRVATNHVHFSKCNRMHHSDSGCSLHTCVCRLQQPAYERRAACCSMQRPAYRRIAGRITPVCSLHTLVCSVRMKAAYARTAGCMQGRMQPASACMPP